MIVYVCVCGCVFVCVHFMRVLVFRVLDLYERLTLNIGCLYRSLSANEPCN